MTLRAIPSDPTFASRHAAWVRSGRVGVEPHPRWATAQALVDELRAPSVTTRRRAGYALRRATARLGVAVDG